MVRVSSRVRVETTAGTTTRSSCHAEEVDGAPPHTLTPDSEATDQRKQISVHNVSDTKYESLKRSET